MVPLDELDDDHKRSSIRRWILVFLGALALAAAGLALFRPAADKGEEGRRAPSFELPYLGREGTLSSGELKGKPVVVNLWASWCVPCREETPALEAMWKKYGDRVTVVGVNVRDQEENALAFAEEFGITYPLVTDDDRSLQKALDSYGLPETFFIDHRWRFLSVVRSGAEGGGGNVYLGGITREELETNIEALIAAGERSR
ncbi:MAG TPA: TlpA disulfide reductase family protein [Actinomycetota bacterium]|nr:TlpA disulfide reductase family protein [Actinomycetota bacterium]